ncbi:MAG: hypothetical protein ABIK15_19205 [Pseudomonadota bacterium]
MIRNIIVYIGIALLSLTFLSCSDSGGESTAAPYPTDVSESVTPGTLYLAKAEGMGSDSRTSYQYDEEPEDVVMQRDDLANDNETIAFDLGDIKASRDFYFILKNIGDTPVTDISIEIDNPSFEVSPSAISLLEPDDEASFMQIICVSAIHGKPLNGIGYTDPMNSGKNSGVILIQGRTTTGDGVDTEAIHSAIIEVTALLIDFEAKTSTSRINFGSPDLSAASSLGGLGWLPLYIISGSPVIENTGNAPFDVSISDSGYASNTGARNTVMPNETLMIEKSSTEMPVFVIIHTNNVICNHEKFSIGNDGNVYFCFREPR